MRSKTQENLTFKDKTAIVIGLGRMGFRHIEACKKLGVHIVGLYDIREATIMSAMNDYCLTDIKTGDVDFLLKELCPDIVVIATTADSHYPYVIQSANNHVPYIFCEKPMACSVAQCEEMLALCKEKGSAICINHFHRFNPLYEKIRNIIAEGKIGTIASVNVIGGNMGLAMNGSHFFEIFRYLTGSLPEKISAVLCDKIVPNPRGDQFFDYAGSVRAVSNSGVRLYFEASSDQGHGIELIISGSAGNIYCDVLNGYIRVMCRKSEYVNLPTTQYAMPADLNEIHMGPSDLVEMTAAMLSAFLIGDNYLSGEQALRIVKLLVLTHVSNAQEHRFMNVSDLTAQNSHTLFSWA